MLVRKNDRKSEAKLSDFEIKIQLGRGTFGKVFLTEYVKTKELYAIKVIRKDVLIEYD